MRDPEMFALTTDDGVVQELAVFSDDLVAYRDQGDWLPLTEDEDDDPLSGLNMVPATADFIADFDMAEESGATLTVHDVS